jgi:hypothetical protein
VEGTFLVAGRCFMPKTGGGPLVTAREPPDVLSALNPLQQVTERHVMNLFGENKPRTYGTADASVPLAITALACGRTDFGQVIAILAIAWVTLVTQLLLQR